MALHFLLLAMWHLLLQISRILWQLQEEMRCCRTISGRCLRGGFIKESFLFPRLGKSELPLRPLRLNL